MLDLETKGHLEKNVQMDVRRTLRIARVSEVRVKADLGGERKESHFQVTNFIAAASS